MDDYINRKQAVDIAESYGLKKGSAAGRHSGIADRIAEAISIMPASNVNIVRHGRWVKAKLKKDYWVFDSDGDFGCWEDYPILCSSCNYDLTENGSRETNYCPNCGCRMDLEDNA